jgi:hypothetical protein
LNSKIKKNNNFYKKIERKKLEIKRMKIKLEKQICSKLGCNDEIKKKKTSIKWSKTKIRSQKNKD